jgi:hypothetical protein
MSSTRKATKHWATRNMLVIEAAGAAGAAGAVEAVEVTGVAEAAAASEGALS